MMTIFMFVLLVCGVFGDEVKSVSVMEGDSLTLHTKFTDTQREEILWRFGPEGSSSLLVHIDGSTPNIKNIEGFKDRLQISNIQSGDLIIKNMRKKHTGLYKAVTEGDAGTFEKKFNVIVYDAPDVLDAGTDEMKPVLGTEGKSVTLQTDVNLQKDDLIVWRFGHEGALIAKDDVEDNKTPEYPDERFKGRLQVNDQTGALIIRDLTYTDSGVYKLKISSNKHIIHKTFSLSVRGVVTVESVAVYEGDSVTLHTDITDIQRDKMLWRFGPEGSSILLVQIVGSKPDITKDVRFKDRLQISDILSGNLTIKNMRKNHAGLYKAVIEGATGTFQKIFNVIVNDAPHVLEAGTGEVKSVSETEGKSVTLQTDVNLQRDALILWRFGHEGALIAKDDVDDNKTPEYTDERFKGRLQVNDQTGDLFIKDLTYTDSGVYKLKISNNKQIIHKTFSLSVRGGGLSAFYKALIWILAIVALVGVLAALWFWYRRSQLKVLPLFVYEGHSVTLSILIKLYRFDVFVWMYGDKEIIAEINRKNNTSSTYDVADERFRGRLELNPQTGSLTINNLKTKHSGLYQLNNTISRGLPWPFSTIATSYCQFNVIVMERIAPVKLGDPVILDTDVKDLKTGDEILWMSGAEDTRIAKFTVGTKDPVFYPYTDDIFRNKLEINPQTGDLTIKDITPERCGIYRVQICTNQRSTYRKFRVSIIVYAEKGESVSLETKGKIQNGDRVEWSFRDDSVKRTSYDKITLVTGVNGDNSKSKFTDDGRFKGRLEMKADNGDLTITNIQETDKGVYTLQQRSPGGKITNWVFSVVFDKIMSVPEEDTVTIPSDYIKLQTGAQIEWKFKDCVIITGEKTNDEGICVNDRNDQQFNGRLELNPSYGHLIINNVSKKDTGHYEGKITNNNETRYTRIKVKVTDPFMPVIEGETVTIPGDYIKLQTGAQIEWKFKDRVIITGEKTNDERIRVNDRNDQQFNGRLELNSDVGSLIIKSISKEDTGYYELNITNNNETSYTRIKVKITVSARTNRNEVEPTVVVPLVRV